MDDEVLGKYRQAHDISDGVIEFAKPLVKPGAKALDIAEKVEKKVVDSGALPSWPVNVSINDVAAHATPGIGDETVINEGDLVKVDVGCQIDGYISDRAFTVCAGKESHPMIDTSKRAMEKALAALEPGVRVCDVSEIIDGIVTDAGYNPVRNLAGHSMSQNSQHEPPSIPNSRTNDTTVIEDGTPIAIEVFTTTGTGWVKESSPSNIYKFLQERPVRMAEARKIVEMAKGRFHGLPFTQRWIEGVSRLKMEMALRQLEEAEALQSYPPLREESGEPVAVWEDTKIVGK